MVSLNMPTYSTTARADLLDPSKAGLRTISFVYRDWRDIIRVLLIDSDRTHAEALCAGLHDLGMSVRRAHSREAGLEALRVDTDDFDLVIINITQGEDSWIAFVRILLDLIRSRSHVPPALLCTTIIPRKTEFEIALHHLGVSLAYEW